MVCERGDTCSHCCARVSLAIATSVVHLCMVMEMDKEMNMEMEGGVDMSS